MNLDQKYLVVIEKGEGNFSAYSPDVPGCIATGETLDETLGNLKEALLFHFEGLQLDGESFPQPRGIDSYWEAMEDSIGETYFFTHLEIASFLPRDVVIETRS